MGGDSRKELKTGLDEEGSIADDWIVWRGVFWIHGQSCEPENVTYLESLLLTLDDPVWIIRLVATALRDFC